MKYAIALSILLAASAQAGTYSHSMTQGVTNTTSHGSLKGVEVYSWKSVDKSYGLLHYSKRVDEIDGVRKISGTFSGNETTLFSGHAVDYNGANFSVMNESTSFSNVADVSVKDKYTTSGYEIDAQWSHKGYSYDYSDYDGSFIRKDNSYSHTAGTTDTVTYSWYE